MVDKRFNRLYVFLLCDSESQSPGGTPFGYIQIITNSLKLLLSIILESAL